jgi:hypothetical protein
MVRFLTVCIPTSNFVFAHFAVRMNPENSSVPGDCFVIAVGEIHFHEPAFPSLRQLTRASNFVMPEHDAPISLAHFYTRSGFFVIRFRDSWNDSRPYRSLDPQDHRYIV